MVGVVPARPSHVIVGNGELIGLGGTGSDFRKDVVRFCRESIGDAFGGGMEPVSVEIGIRGPAELGASGATIHIPRSQQVVD